MKAAAEEMDGLTEQGVVEHDFTMPALDAAGVKRNKETGCIKPIPLSVHGTGSQIYGWAFVKT